jgi:hypothetical protein
LKYTDIIIQLQDLDLGILVQPQQQIIGKCYFNPAVMACGQKILYSGRGLQMRFHPALIHVHIPEYISLNLGDATDDYRCTCSAPAQNC